MCHKLPKLTKIDHDFKMSITEAWLTVAHITLLPQMVRSYQYY